MSDDKEELLSSVKERMEEVKERVRFTCTEDHCFDDALEQYDLIERIVDTCLADTEDVQEIKDELFDLRADARGEKRVKRMHKQWVEQHPEWKEQVKRFDDLVAGGMDEGEAFNKVFGKGTERKPYSEDE